MTSNIEMSRRMDILFHFGSTFFFSILNDNESMKFARSNNTRFYSSTDVLVAIGHNSQLTLTSHCSARISHISFTVTSRHFFSFLFSLLFFLLFFFFFFFSLRSFAHSFRWDISCRINAQNWTGRW